MIGGMSFNFFPLFKQVMSSLLILWLAVTIVVVGISLVLEIGFGMLSVKSPLFVGRWQLFRKMGIDGWKSTVPYYNTYVLLGELYHDKSVFWKMMFIPIYRVYLFVKFYIDLGNAFGVPTSWKWGMIFLNFVFIPLVGMSEYEYLDGAKGTKDRFVLGGVELFPQKNDIPFKAKDLNADAVCPNCGATLRAGAKFCTKCGKKL